MAERTIRIAIDPVQIPDADVEIAITTGEGDGGRTTLEFEDFKRFPHTGTVLMKCYDCEGSVVWVTMRQRLIEQLVFGDLPL